MNSIINNKLINLELKGQSKEEIIVELSQLLNIEGKLKDIDLYIEEVLKRESLSTTGVGFGVAIPHGKSNSVEVPAVAFGRINNGVEWQSLDGEPVHSIFLIAVPEDSACNTHLKILAALSRKLMCEEFREEISKENNPDTILDILEKVFKSVAN